MRLGPADPGDSSLAQTPHLPVRKATPSLISFPVLPLSVQPVSWWLSLCLQQPPLQSAYCGRLATVTMGLGAMSIALSFEHWLPPSVGSLGTCTRDWTSEALLISSTLGILCNGGEGLQGTLPRVCPCEGGSLKIINSNLAIHTQTWITDAAQALGSQLSGRRLVSLGKLSFLVCRLGASVCTCPCSARQAATRGGKCRLRRRSVFQLSPGTQRPLPPPCWAGAGNRSWEESGAPSLGKVINTNDIGTTTRL